MAIGMNSCRNAYRERTLGRIQWRCSFYNIENLKSTETYPLINSPISDDCKSFLDLCFEIDPEKRGTTEKLLKHPFLSISEKELKQSLEASNFISFFSILASQKSLSDQGNFINNYKKI